MQKYWLFLDTIMLLDDATVSDYCVGRNGRGSRLFGGRKAPPRRETIIKVVWRGWEVFLPVVIDVNSF